MVIASDCLVCGAPFSKHVENLCPKKDPDNLGGLRDLRAKIAELENRIAEMVVNGKQISYEFQNTQDRLAEVEKAAQDVCDFCWPDGKWRGDRDMKGILSSVSNLRNQLDKKE